MLVTGDIRPQPLEGDALRVDTMNTKATRSQGDALRVALMIIITTSAPTAAHPATTAACARGTWAAVSPHPPGSPTHAGSAPWSNPWRTPACVRPPPHPHRCVSVRVSREGVGGGGGDLWVSGVKENAFELALANNNTCCRDLPRRLGGGCHASGSWVCREPHTCSSDSAASSTMRDVAW
jgi:hypothetical protein